MGDIHKMKFDRNGKIVWSLRARAVETQNSLSPDTMQELEKCGMERSAVKIVADMVPAESVGELLEIIESLARLQK